MALALIRRIVHCDHNLLSFRASPREDYEAIVGPVSIPGRRRFKKSPFPVANSWLPQHVQQSIVKLPKVFISRLNWSTNEVRRNSFSVAFKLPVVEETQARRKKCDDRRGLMHVSGKRGGGSRLIMVLKKSSELILVVRLRE